MLRGLGHTSIQGDLSAFIDWRDNNRLVTHRTLIGRCLSLTSDPLVFPTHLAVEIHGVVGLAVLIGTDRKTVPFVRSGLQRLGAAAVLHLWVDPVNPLARRAVLGGKD